MRVPLLSEAAFEATIEHSPMRPVEEVRGQLPPDFSGVHRSDETAPTSASYDLGDGDIAMAYRDPGTRCSTTTSCFDRTILMSFSSW